MTWGAIISSLFLGSAVARGQTVDAAIPLPLTVSEVMAMGGAGIGFAHGAAGLLYNPAAPAVRRVESHDNLNGTVVLTTAHSRPGDATDLTNVGPGYTRIEEWMLAAGATGSLGRFGAGPAFTALQVDLGEGRVWVADGHFALAATSARTGQHAAGLGARLVGVEVATDDGRRQRFMGTGVEGGIALASQSGAWNLGLLGRSPVHAAPAEDSAALMGITAVAVPWQAGVGMGWCSPGVRSPAAPGPAVRLAADVMVYGPVRDGLALVPLLSGEEVERGRAVSISPHLGAEAEVWPDRLKLRGGSYLEPGRTESRPARAHVTGGMELRLLHLRALWGLIDHDLTWEAYIDHAEDYTRVSWLGVGVWHGGQVTGRTPAPP